MIVRIITGTLSVKNGFGRTGELVWNDTTTRFIECNDCILRKTGPTTAKFNLEDVTGYTEEYLFSIGQWSFDLKIDPDCKIKYIEIFVDGERIVPIDGGYSLMIVD